MPDRLVREIQQTFIERGLTLSIAESCTGGALSARLTVMPDCSRYFLGSIIAYTNDLKTRILKVDPAVLSAYGAVSGPVVEQMAQGALELTASDYSLAVSGLAGPGGGSSLTPVGTIWAAVATRQKPPFTWTFHLKGSREGIIAQATEILLKQLSLLL